VNMVAEGGTLVHALIAAGGDGAVPAGAHRKK